MRLAGWIAALAVASPALAQTTVLVDDGFGDGDRDNDLILDGAATNPADTGSPWYLARGIDDVVLTVADDVGGIGLGSSLDVLSMTTFNRPIATKFDPTTLEQDGDRISVRLVARATEVPIDVTDGGTFPTANSDRRFRFGLYSSNGTPLPDADNDDPVPSDDDTGYLTVVDVGTASGNSLSIFGDQADGILGGSSVSLGASDDGSSNFLANAPRVFEMILTRQGDNILVAATIDGALVQTGEADFVEDIQPFNLPYTFDYVAFGTNGGSVDYRVDSVIVTFTRPDTTPPQMDGFEDGDRDNDGIAEGPINDPADVGFNWYKATGTSSFDIGVVDESGGIGSGNAVQPYASTTSTRGIASTIQEVTLASDGDYVRYSFDLRIDDTLFFPNSDRRFRFGLYDNGGTPVTEDGSTQEDDDVGYMVQMDTGASSSSTATVRGDFAGGILTGSTRSLGGTTEDPMFALDDTDTHRLELEIRRRTDVDLGYDVNDVTLRFDGMEATMGTDEGDGAGDTNPLTFTFNQIAVGTNNVAFLDYRVDNVQVETNVGVEPMFADNDGFEDGDRENDGVLEGDENDPADVGFQWYASRGTSSFEVDIVNDDAGIGTGNALKQLSITTSSRALSAAIEPVTLENAGESVRLEFDMRLNGSIPNEDRRFRFGIHDNGGTPVTADGSSQSGDDTGYMVQTDTGPSSASTATVRGDLPNGLLSGSTRSTGGTTEDPAFSIDDNNVQRLAIEVERAFDSDLGRDVNIIRFYYDGVLATEGIDSGDGAGDTNPLTYSFNQISIGTSGAAFLDILVDNVTVTSDAVNPCLADLAPPFGVLDLSDITAFVSAFTNQQPLADVAEPFGVYDLSDISTFIDGFLTGCP